MFASEKWLPLLSDVAAYVFGPTAGPG